MWEGTRDSLPVKNRRNRRERICKTVSQEKKNYHEGGKSSSCKMRLGRQTCCLPWRCEPLSPKVNAEVGGRCHHLSLHFFLPAVGAWTKSLNSKDPFKSTNLRVRLFRTRSPTFLQPALHSPLRDLSAPRERVLTADTGEEEAAAHRATLAPALAAPPAPATPAPGSTGEGGRGARNGKSCRSHLAEDFPAGCLVWGIRFPH